jgi:hypothetical protein
MSGSNHSDGVPNRLTAGRVQIHAIALAECIHATPSNPSLAEVVVVHTARPPVHYRVAYMSAVCVVQVDALSGQCGAQSAHKADEHEQASRPYCAVDPTAEPLPEGPSSGGHPEEPTYSDSRMDRDLFRRAKAGCGGWPLL